MFPFKTETSVRVKMSEEAVIRNRQKIAKKALKAVVPLGIIGLILTGVGLYLVWQWYLTDYIGSLELSLTLTLTVGVSSLAIGLCILSLCTFIMEKVVKKAKLTTTLNILLSAHVSYHESNCGEE